MVHCTIIISTGYVPWTFTSIVKILSANDWVSEALHAFKGRPHPVQAQKSTQLESHSDNDNATMSTRRQDRNDFELVFGRIRSRLIGFMDTVPNVGGYSPLRLCWI